MKNKTEQDIIHYIDYLRSNGYIVTLSCFHFDLIRNSVPILHNYIHHFCEVCFFLKAHPETQGKCSFCKRLLIDSTSKEVFYNCCWAGIEEYVFPIIYLDQLVCRVHISGYRGTLARSKRRSGVLIKKLGEPFAKLYAQLSTDVPTQSFLEQLVAPLGYMFQVLVHDNLAEMPGDVPSLKLYFKTLEYIYSHYMDNIQTETIAQAFNYSASYFRAVFLKYSKITVMEQVNAVRLSHAVELLRYTNLPITRIAYECGFRDGNYFSTVFKKTYGIPPSTYRNTPKLHLITQKEQDEFLTHI